MVSVDPTGLYHVGPSFMHPKADSWEIIVTAGASVIQVVLNSCNRYTVYQLPDGRRRQSACLA